MSPSHLPRWRGFNLLEKFIADHQGPFREEDFTWIAGWGFDFVRLPLSYWCWGDPNDWKLIREQPLEEIDRAVEYGRQHHIHVNINFHRAPGYCVNPPAERLSLWSNEEALEACAHHWAQFARRYRGIPSERVSFDLVNEPGEVPEPEYVRVVSRLAAAIHAEDPHRLIVADGLFWGNKPVPGLVGTPVAQSTRGYTPMQVSHYRASWVQGADRWPTPTWPLHLPDGETWDRERLQKERIDPWMALEDQGVGIHVGEWGCHQFTPHTVALAWMKDCLQLWKEAGWGGSLWNLRGSFGILDSARTDVRYEPFHGHQLDRQMLELLLHEG